jgi:hypothetical protein
MYYITAIQPTHYDRNEVEVHDKIVIVGVCGKCTV